MIHHIYQCMDLNFVEEAVFHSVCSVIVVSVISCYVFTPVSIFKEFAVVVTELIVFKHRVFNVDVSLEII